MTAETPRPHWHTLDAEAVCRHLDADENGLTEAEAARRAAEAGPNALPRMPPPAWWQVFGRQFASPVIYILIIAAAVSLAIGHPTDAGFIGFVVLLNALIGGFQEHRAERSARALQQLLRTRAAVQREGDVRDVDAESIVPGDIVWLESGNRVPADVRLLAAHGLEVDESLLTGESLAVTKDATRTAAAATPLGDRLNMAFAGTIVVHGRARAIVVETGTRTQVGELAVDVLGAPAGKPPLLVRLGRFTHVVGVAVLVAAFAVGIMGVVIRDYSVTDMFIFAVALAVSAIPEGLPITITVALAIAATRMARRGLIVRRLGAVEGLGSCTFIASDKTGTLTCNEITVREVRLNGDVYAITGEGFTPQGQVMRGSAAVGRGQSPALDRLALAAVLCNEADLHHHDGHWSFRGDPTDIALLSMARKIGWIRKAELEHSPQMAQIPFEPELRYAASFHEVQGQVRIYAKGAPERVLRMCDVEPALLEATHRQAEAMAAAGYRVLAFADGPGPPGLRPDHVPPEPAGLTFIGLAGMIDPLRPGVREAVGRCAQAGNTVSMVTGDHPVTALAIARDLGFADRPEQVITGDALAALDEPALAQRLDSARVFARVAPGQKLAIVRAAQKAGHFVAVTGDGANDAPALRAANIGVAMGRGGTDVAREAGDLVISDDNFATIVAGVDEGRIAYDNIRKVTYLLVSTGAAEVVLVILAVASGSPLPLLPAQLLWLNLVTNGIQDVALAFEPGEGDTLHRPPRPPRERIFNRLMIENCLFAACVMGLLGFGVFQWLLRAGWTEASARNALLLLMVLFENVHIGNCRSETRSALGLSPLRSPILLSGAVGALLLHVCAMHLPFGWRLLGTEPVSWTGWLGLGGVAIAFFWAVQVQKWTWRRRRGI